ncbi:receptor-like protein 35 [Abrus precatorius]|uniref:Receptor-like protein 35 n=1 Tax=Abrus precatorius TaxID=3816 RepID=A0A8B8JMB3_ABRPR|nr:receptor-like protein 35 [Abrus precatorius]
MGRFLVLSLHLFLFLLASFHSHSYSLAHSHDTFTLLQFNNSFTVNFTHYYYPDLSFDCPRPYPRTNTWKNGTDCCSWLGVTCHPTSGHVIALDLTCSGLSGKIEANSSLFRLSHLQSLNLAFNNLSQSPLSSLFGGLTSMSITHLNLSGSLIEGEIPIQISHLSKLSSLDLSFNYDLRWKERSWKRLLQNATLLRDLVLDRTDMSSTSIKPINLASSLRILHLSRCQFQGSIPPSFSNLTRLTSLDLSRNELNGSIPSSFSNLTRLTSLDLSWNNLNGSIPSSFSNLTRLTSLDLSGNNIGSIPSSFSNLTRLTSLDLSWNNLNGSIPSSFSNLTRLTSLYLSSNKLSSIPSSFSNLTRLTSLYLSGNNIGSIPSSFSNLTRLTSLDLSWNNLSSIPDMFGGLINLEAVRLNDNKLGGQIPSSLFDLTHLSLLDCSYNQLEGPLLTKITGLSNLTYLSLNNNLLNETIPSWCLSLPSLVQLDLSTNHFTGHISAISSYSLEYLDLSSNKLHGNIPQSIFSLANLTHLDLSFNNLSGLVYFPLFSKLQNLKTISLSQNTQLSLNFESNVNYSFPILSAVKLSSLGLTEFPKLRRKLSTLGLLDLSNNKLNGRVPNYLCEMDSLRNLNLSHNFLTSTCQFLENQELQHLDLSFNLLADDISLSKCNARELAILNLSHNKLTGIIPQCLANLSSLAVLDLQENKLYGTLPSAFSNSITLLNLNGNKIEGFLPKSLSNCTGLEVLDLGNNQIMDTFPHWLEAMPYLRVLVLRANKLHGPISNLKAKHLFPSLKVFDISHNNFVGPIPKSYMQKFKAMKNVVQDEADSNPRYIEIPLSISYINRGEIISFDDIFFYYSMTITIKGVSVALVKVPKIFVNIDLSRNKFEGEIPRVIGELHALKGLNLSHNRLIGPIPQSMGNLTNLESLDLSSNMLNGEIPTELSNLNFLEVLNLSQNRLVGEIPKGKQFNTFSNDSYVGNLGLCGFPMSIDCNNDPKHGPSPSPAFWNEQKFGFGWKPVAIGYGCGMVFGIALGCCLLSIGKPQWLVRMVGDLPNKRAKRRTRMTTHERMH